MKRILFLAGLILVFCVMPVSAKDAFKGTVITSTLLDNDPTSVTSSAIDVSQYDKIAFFVYADETDSGNDTKITVTIEVSYDNSVWLAANFWDYAGAAARQTTQDLCVGADNDENWYCWMQRRLNVPYARVVVTGTGTAAGGDDEVTVTVNFSAQK